MAEIPAALPAAAAQAALRSREIAAADDARRAGETEAATKGVRTVDEAGVMVDTEDQDTQVFADSEGLGGQGRADDGGKEASSDNQPKDDNAAGITRSANGQVHLDLTA